MHIGIFAAGIENGRHWPWSTRSLGHFDSQNVIQCRTYTLIQAGQGVLGLHVPNALLFVTDTQIYNDFRPDNIVFPSLLSISFYWYEWEFMYVLKKIPSGQNVHHSLGQKAHVRGRFTP